ncbi:pinopsin-like [Periophthalmus magnuspinnatus]|uniref:pinopsin-like n=1 Tax=Periophthalmus magnuspinnatus TaxID=409849 RepID=UPI00145B7CBC|nr:pinopsin-like [Periophthalmus magnuspinnatus]
MTLLQHSPNLSALWDPSAPRHAALSRTGHTAVAVVLGFIFVLGFLGNFVALLVFSRYPVLRTPVNLLLINISASDMLVCIFGTPMSFAASVRGRWLTGSYGCRWYGFSNALFGIVSLISLSLLSFERYSAVVHSVPSDSSQFGRARFAVSASWLYSLAWTLPPLLGWSSYGPEGPGTTCSVQWDRQSPTARSYVSCLFTFCLLLPLLLMLFCYGRIIMAVRTVTKQVPRLSQSAAERREGRVLLMVVSMVTSYLVCWLPYGVVAMLFSFGRPGAVPPVASLVPSLLAKTSTVLNPVIYVLLNKQFSRCFRHMFSWTSEAVPTPVHQSFPSSRGAWIYPPEMPSVDQDSSPDTFFPQPQKQGPQHTQTLVAYYNGET